MFRPRVIPIVLVDRDGQAVKTVKFGKRIYLGDPVNTVSLFNAFRVDELALLDIDASRDGRRIPDELLSDIASEAKMPFSVGGGLRTIEDIRRVLSLGAEKVVLSTIAARRPSFVREASRQFGASSLMVCIDVKRSLLRKQHVYVAGDRRRGDWSPVDFAKLMEDSGAGELIVQSVDRDGTMAGYDLDLLNQIADSVTIPVIALGGAGALTDLLSAYRSANVSALAAGSLFVFRDRDRGVLVNYPPKDQLKRFRDIR